jgi:hypothetical protein
MKCTVCRHPQLSAINQALVDHAFSPCPDPPSEIAAVEENVGRESNAPPADYRRRAPGH